MTESFQHEKLLVYQRAVVLCTRLSELAFQWEDKHDITDHLPRAAESIVMNLAEACAAHGGTKQTLLDYALGSTLECAACLDIASIKSFTSDTVTRDLKSQLSEVFKMLFGLGKSWQPGMVKEDAPSYGHSEEHLILFNHERLQVYQKSLEIIRQGCDPKITTKLSGTDFRRIDSFSTSIVLNIAEGNGRYSSLDHGRFMDIAHRASIKLAAKLDILCGQGILMSCDVQDLKNDLLHVTRMSHAMIQEFKYNR